MRKLNYLFMLLAVPAMLTFTGCGDSEDPAPEDCATAVFPTTSGTASVSFLNFTTDTDGDNVIDVNTSAGDVLAIAVQINKGTNRPQKLRVYQTDCANALGTQVKFDGQKDVSNDGTIDLRNDDNQVRNVNFTVPTGVSTLYLNFEVDESGSKYTYKKMKLKISGSGVVDSYTGVILGDQSNSNPSRMASATGLTYTSCNAAGNIDDIDITYAVSKTSASGGSCSTTSTTLSYIVDNDTRFTCPIGLATATITCGDETLDVDGGPTVYYKTNTTSIDFANVDDAALSALSVSSTNNHYVQLTGVGQVIEFLTTNNRKGLIKVTALSSKDAAGGTITIDVKVQR